MPHENLVREVPKDKSRYPCGLLLPFLVLVGDKTHTAHRVVLHNGTMALHTGRIFKLRRRGLEVYHGGLDVSSSGPQQCCFVCLGNK
jgi:hypothetical protein